MNTFKRISATLTAQINAMIDQVEDHEAVANVALSDIRDSLTRTKYQVRRIQNEQRGFEQRLAELKVEEAKWQDRARSSASDNRDRAIECVRRLKKAQSEIATIEQQLNAHVGIERDLAEDIRKIETKFQELKLKRSILAARESRADALGSVAKHHGATDVGGVFDRWEQRIMRGEAISGSLSEPADRLNEEFEIREDEKDLELILAKIIESKN